MEDDILVDIVMVTYNHEKYIRQAIESVLQQECNFKYRLIIADDCSKDNTASICKEFTLKFPTTIYFIEQLENKGLVLNYKSSFDACRAEFIAILEGDDYWIDSKKLQKQVDILREDPSFGLVHSGFKVAEIDGQFRVANLGVSEHRLEGKLFEAVFKDEVVFCPLTVVFRRSLLSWVDYEFCIKNNVWTIDAFLWPEFSYQTTIRYLPEVTGVYRRSQAAATSTLNPDKLIWYFESGLKMKLYYFYKYPIEGLNDSQLKSKYLKNLIVKLFEIGAKARARSYLMKYSSSNFVSIAFVLLVNIPFIDVYYKNRLKILSRLSQVKQKYFLSE